MDGERVIERRPPRRAHGIGAIAALAVATGSTVWLYIEYAGAARSPMLALGLAGTFLGLAFAVLHGFRAMFVFETVEAPRPTPAPSEELPVDLGIGARRGFIALVAGAAASLVGTLLLPLRALGTSPRPTLRATAWRPGVRLLTPDGAPLRLADVTPGSATPVVPSSAPDDPNSVAVLIRLRGAVVVRAYSRICTHAGCAVCVFRAKESHLVCPCHYSVFDAADGGRILSGPASRSLPELPLSVDAEGFLVADGDFNGPIGPRAG